MSDYWTVGAPLSELTEKLQQADDWSTYYAVYRDTYCDLLKRRWALGRPAFVNQLHNAAIPDVSGSTCGILRWASYSQPSLESLQEFFAVFCRLLTAEPHRARSSRYLFFVPHADTAFRSMLANRLLGHGLPVDFWADTLDNALAVPPEFGAIDSLNALTAGDAPVIPRQLMQRATSDSRMSTLMALMSTARQVDVSQQSMFPRLVWGAFIDSSFILAAFRQGISAQDFAASCGRGSIGPQLAIERARSSEWEPAAVRYCEEIAAVSPPKSTRYRIKPGDILSAIVREQYELSFHQVWPVIRALNPDLTDPNRIVAGRDLLLPVLEE